MSKKQYAIEDDKIQSDLTAFTQEATDPTIGDLTRELAICRATLAANTKNPGVIRAMSDCIVRLTAQHEKSCLKSGMYLHREVIFKFAEEFVKLVTSKCKGIPHWEQIVDNDLKPELLKLLLDMRNPQRLIK